MGWVKGENLLVEERWADGYVNRLPDLMTDFVRAKVDIIITYNTAAAIAAKKAVLVSPSSPMAPSILKRFAAALRHVT